MRFRRGRKHEAPPVDQVPDNDLLTGAVRIIRPDEASTDAAATDTAAPDAAAPDTAATDAAASDTTAPDAPSTDTAASDTAAPDAPSMDTAATGAAVESSDPSPPDNGFLDISAATSRTAATSSVTQAVPVSEGLTDEPALADQGGVAIDDAAATEERSKSSESKSSDSKRKRRGRRRAGGSGDEAVDANDTVVDGPDEVADGAEQGSPGGDPLLHRGPTDVGDGATSPSAEPAAGSLGRNGVRIIPAASSTAGSSDTASGLDPTAPYVGPIGDGDDVGPGGVGLGDDLGSGVTLHPTDGDGDGDGSRQTIVINDDGTSAMAAETGVARGRIDPKFRARRKAVRRSMGRKRIAVLVVGVVVVVFGVIVGALLGSPLFALKPSEVHVTGWKYANEDEMYAIFDDLAGTPVLRIDEDEVEARLEAVPWVEQAAVDAKLPNSADIQIRERIPLATYQGADGRFRVLDRDGRVLEIVDGMPVEYMWITVSDPPDLEPGEFAATGIAAASEMTRSLTPTIRPRVRRIAVDQSGSSMAVYLRDGTRVNFGAARDIFAKLVRLETLLTDFPGMNNVRIDVSTAETTRSSASLLELTDGASEAPVETSPEPAADASTGDGSGATDTAGDGATGDGN